MKRFGDENGFVADMIYNEEAGEPKSMTIVDPLDAEHRKEVTADMSHSDLLVPIFRQGNFVGTVESLEIVRGRVAKQLAGLHRGIKRFVNPHSYPCGLDSGLHQLKIEMIRSLRK